MQNEFLRGTVKYTIKRAYSFHDVFLMVLGKSLQYLYHYKICFFQVSIEAIYIAVQSFIYTLLLFSMMDFGWRADKFFWFFFLTFMCFIYFTLYGMMAVAITPSYQVAGVVSSFFYSFWNLFCGFVLPRKVRNFFG